MKLKNSGEVFHIWAQQNEQKEGKAGNVFFEGLSVYSYGHHFEMARFITPGVVFFTDRTYSVTTARHMSEAQAAVSHKTTFTVPSFTDHNENAKHLSTAIRVEVDRIDRSTAAFKWAMSYLDGQVKQALLYLETFKKNIHTAARKEIRDAVKYRLTVLSAARMEEKTAKFDANAEKRAAREKYFAENPDAAETARLKKIEAKQRKLERERAAFLEREAANIERWKNGEYVSTSYNWPTMLRIKENEIQTSRGANVPLIEARKFWHALQRRESVIGMRLGHYTVDGLDGDTLRVGCHNIPVREVVRMARALNWNDGTTLEAVQL